MPTLETIAGLRDFSPSRSEGSDSRAASVRPAAWFVPDLAMAAAFATLVCLFGGFGGATALFRDSDAGWHIRNGEAILTAMRLPQVDSFSFSKPGAPWMAWEWASDVLMGAIHRNAGLGGVATLFGLAIATSIWMWFRLTRAAGGNFLLAALFAAPMITTTDMHWLARPHIFGWLFAMGAVWWCESAPQRLEWRALAGIAILSAVWANLHGSFVVGPAIASVYACGAWLRASIWKSGGARNASVYLTAAAVSALGSLVNPHGWLLHRQIAAYLSDSALLNHIGEFQSFDFRSAGAAWVLAAVLLGILGGCAALAIRRPERFLLAVGLTAAALTSARSLPLAALILLPLANGSITEVLSLARGMRQGARRKLDGFLRYGDALGALDLRFRGYALVPVVAALLFVGVRARAEFPGQEFPVAASGAIAALPADARIFASDKFGGYLIYRFNGQRKVFFDGRSDFYGADFVERYARMTEVRPGWREEFARWNFGYALLPSDAPLRDALAASGWHEIHRDPVAVLLARDSQ